MLTLLKDRKITIKNSISKLQQIYKKIESGVEFIKDNPALDLAVKTAISAIPIAGPVIREIYDGVGGNGSEKQNTQDLLSLLQNLEKMNDKQFVDQAIQIKQNRKEILKNRQVFLEQIKRSEDLLSNKILVTNESVLKNREFLEHLEQSGEITHELLLEIKHLTEIKDEKLDNVNKKLDRILRGESAQLKQSVETDHDKTINTKPTISHTKNFVGRQIFIDKIKTMMDKSNKPISITGVAGLGKSKLAYEVITQYQSKYDKVIIFDFTKFRKYDKFLSDFASYLDLSTEKFDSLETDDDKVNVIQNTLLELKHVLLYADNFETISILFHSKKNESHLKDAQQIVSLLESVPNNTLVLLSSRIEDNLVSERLVDLEGLSKEEGREMFIKLIPNHFSKEPSDEIRNILEKLSEKTGGHPLSIELLARSYKGNGIPELQNMFEHLGVGVTNKRSSNERLQSLEKCFEFSINSLNENYAKLLPKLTVFSSYFTPQGAQQVLGIDHDVLQEFYDHGMLRRIDFDEKNPLEFRLYGFHAATKNYLEKQIDIPSLEQQVKKSFVSYYEDLANFTYKSLSSNQHRVPSVNRFKIMMQGENDFEKASSLDESSGSFIYNQIGLVVQSLGNLSSALEYAKKALVIDEKNNDEVRMAIRYNNIGQILQDEGNLSSALEYAKKALVIDEKYNDEVSMARDYNNIGLILKAQGNLDGALDNMKKSRDILLRLSEPVNVVTVCISIGYLQVEMKNMDDAIQSFLQAESIVNSFEKETGNKHPSSEIIKNIMSQIRGENESE